MANIDDWPEGMDRVSEQCLVCKEWFFVTRDASPDISEAKKALRLRVGTHHCKTREDFSLAAARIVREAAEDR
jgi:hypothetical protein